jgi:hypothetical protein
MIRSCNECLYDNPFNDDEDRDKWHPKCQTCCERGLIDDHWTPIPKLHRWSESWPGNFCIDCGLEDDLDQHLVQCQNCLNGCIEKCDKCCGTGAIIDPEYIRPGCLSKVTGWETTTHPDPAKATLWVDCPICRREERFTIKRTRNTIVKCETTRVPYLLLAPCPANGSL